MLTTFSIILDDIVFPDGRTRMGVLGGGGPQTAFGMRLWADEAGISAGVGEDFPAEALGWFEQSGVDVQGLRRSPDLPTPRAWQVLEEDGRRTQVWRVPGPVIGRHLRKRVEDLPPAYRASRGFHLGLHPLEPDFDFLEALRALGGVISVEPFKPAEQRPEPGLVRRLLSLADVFAPNLEEAVSLVGPGEPQALLERLAGLGGRVLALRMGAEGSLALDAATGRVETVPAVPVKVVDPVGAGNAYCGGFLAGWVETGDIRIAALYGSVAASFLVEQVGVPVCTAAVRAEARRRMGKLERRE